MKKLNKVTVQLEGSEKARTWRRRSDGRWAYDASAKYDVEGYENAVGEVHVLDLSTGEAVVERAESGHSWVEPHKAWPKTTEFLLRALAEHDAQR